MTKGLWKKIWDEDPFIRTQFASIQSFSKWAGANNLDIEIKIEYTERFKKAVEHHGTRNKTKKLH